MTDTESFLISISLEIHKKFMVYINLMKEWEHENNYYDFIFKAIEKNGENMLRIRKFLKKFKKKY